MSSSSSLPLLVVSSQGARTCDFLKPSKQRRGFWGPNSVHRFRTLDNIYRSTGCSIYPVYVRLVF